MRILHLLRDVALARDERELEARLMDGLARPFGARAWGLYLICPDGTPSSIAVAGVEERFVEEYERFGRSVDPVMRFLRERHAPAHERLVLAVDDWRRCDLYREVSHRYRLEHIMEGPIVADGRLVGTVNLARGADSRPFDDADLRDLTALSLHLSARVAVLRSGHEFGRNERLTPRELEIARLVARGLANAQIGAELYVTEHAVKQALKRMYAKLGIHSRAALVAELHRLSTSPLSS